MKHLKKLISAALESASFPQDTLACPGSETNKPAESSGKSDQEFGPDPDNEFKAGKPCDWYRCNERYFFGF